MRRETKEKIMKRFLLLALPIAFLAGCGGCKGKGGEHGGWKKELTPEQKACLKKQGCPKPESKDDKAAWEKFKKCKVSAMSACGIKKPDGKYACNDKGIDGAQCKPSDTYAEINEEMEMSERQE
jgi:hypothetical protein